MNVQAVGRVFHQGSFSKCVHRTGVSALATTVGKHGRLDRNDEYTLRLLTDDGLPRLSQSRRETSSSSADDVLDDSRSAEMDALGPT